MDSGGLDEGAELFEFIDEVLRDRERGLERPLSEYLARYPGCDEAVAREWLALRETGGAEPAAEGDPDERRIGPWRLVRELGRGGQGAVWLAEDSRIARRVALKLLPDTFALLDTDRRSRLRREAEALARLDHPAICPVLEAQIEGESPYIAMRLVEGESLAAAIVAARKGSGSAAPLVLPPQKRDELESLLAFFEQAARALHAAHEAGVVHRDVKPGNIMVTPKGGPVLLDFGQAHDESATLAARTLTGDVVGTPAYMSPEQVRGRSREIDARTDVWSLGATLYEALTLERPFEGASVAELALAIDGGALPVMREKGLSRDLAVVLETALERDLNRRYATALDLAEDLRRLREHEPVRARPAGPLLRLSRWTRRHPAIAASLTAVLLALTTGLAWTLHLLAREQLALDFALGSHLAKRTVALIDEDPAAALALGIQAVKLAPNYETRSALLTALDACSLESLVEAPAARRILDLAVSPDGYTAAAATDIGTVVLFDLTTRKPLGELAASQEAVRALAFKPAGELVTAGDDGLVRWWDPVEQVVLREVPGPGGALHALAIDSTGERLAVSGAGGRLALLAATDGSLQAELKNLGVEPDTLRFTPDGARLLAFHRGLPGQTAAPDAPALVVDVETGRIERELGVAAETLTWACLIPAKQAYATASHAGVVRVESLVDGRLLAGPLEFPGPVWCVAASPDGERLAIACEEGDPSRAWLWRPWEDELVPLPGHDQSRVVHAAFSPDGSRVATSSYDSTVRVFDTVDARAAGVFRGLLQALESQWTRDSSRVITLSNGNYAPVWFAHGPPDVYTLAGHTGPVTRARFSGDGTRALTVSKDGTARLWNTAPVGGSQIGARATGDCIALLERQVESAVMGARFATGGTEVLTWRAWGEAGHWMALNGVPLQPGGYHSAGYRQVEPTPEGPGAALIDTEGRAWLLARWPPEGEHTRLGNDVDATCLEFAPDGSRLAVGTSRGRLDLFDARGTQLGSWTPELEPGYEAGVVDLAFSPDSSQLALACSDRRVRFVRLGETIEQARDPLVVFPPLTIDWSADGTRLLVIGPEGRGAFRLHDLVNDRQVTLEVFHGANLTCGEFSPDGLLVLSGSLDGTVYVRSAADGTPVARLVGHTGPVLDAAFSRDSRPLRVITASADGTARVWPVKPLPPALARQPRELKPWERRREARLAEPLHYR